MKNKQAVGVVILNHKDEVLLLQRGPNARSNHGQWENCGGAIEEGETREQAAIRECREEIGADIKLGELLFSFVDDNGWEGFVFKAELLSEPIIQELNICSDMKWVTKSELKNMDLTSYCREDFVKLGWL